MSKSTKHIQGRMSQRAIKGELVELVQRFGELDGDKVVLTKNALLTLLDENGDLKKSAQEALKKGGIVVVQSQDILITTYRLDSYKRMAG